MKNLPVHAWHVLSGIGTADRSELCSFIAMFQDASLLKIAFDRLQDFKPGDDESATAKLSTYQQRLERSADNLKSSSLDDRTLRLMLWAEMRSALGCPSSAPVSLRSASTAGSDLTSRAAKILGSLVEPETADPKTWKETIRQMPGRALAAIGFGPTPRFEDVVAAQAARLVANAIESGDIDDAKRQVIADEFRKRLAELPPELRSEAARKAVSEGDTAIISFLAGGGALVGLGVAVELAGFGAYILAAQASAVIPLLGGKAAVSTLFVLANPLFIVPALIGGGWFAKSKVETAVRERLGAGLTVLLALRGLTNSRSALEATLNSFKLATPVASNRVIQPYLDQISATRESNSGQLPICAGSPPGNLAQLTTEDARDDMDRILFPDRDTSIKEVAAVGGLTVGEIVYSAAAIDPSVIAAADFSRTADLSDIFSFGAFAETIGAMSDRAQIGAESNLRGYVAEQIVAARLIDKGHQVDVPDAANNPGFDLLVDGEKFQVKCLLDKSGIAEHFEKYPDINVYANADLMEEIAQSGAEWAERVYFLEGYDYQTADALMDDSLSAGEELLDIDVPFFAIAVSATKHVHGWWKGSVELSDIPFEIAVDGAVKGSLAVAGGLAGKALGLVLLGPAGAVVFGSAGGVLSLFGSSAVRSTVDSVLRRSWLKDLDTVSQSFAAAIRSALDRKYALVSGKLAQLPETQSDEINWIRQRMLDDQIFVAEGIALARKLSETGRPEDRARDSLKAMHDFAVHPSTVQAELADLLKVLNERPGLTDVMEDGWDWTKSWAKRT